MKNEHGFRMYKVVAQDETYWFAARDLSDFDEFAKGWAIYDGMTPEEEAAERAAEPPQLLDETSHGLELDRPLGFEGPAETLENPGVTFGPSSPRRRRSSASRRRLTDDTRIFKARVGAHPLAEIKAFGASAHRDCDAGVPAREEAGVTTNRRSKPPERVAIAVAHEHGLLVWLDLDLGTNATSRCWSCRQHRKLERAHIDAHRFGGRGAARNFFLLCSVCHGTQPDRLPPDEQYRWLLNRPGTPSSRRRALESRRRPAVSPTS